MTLYSEQLCWVKQLVFLADSGMVSLLVARGVCQWNGWHRSRCTRISTLLRATCEFLSLCELRLAAFVTMQSWMVESLQNVASYLVTDIVRMLIVWCNLSRSAISGNTADYAWKVLLLVWEMALFTSMPRPCLVNHLVCVFFWFFRKVQGFVAVLTWIDRRTECCWPGTDVATLTIPIAYSVNKVLKCFVPHKFISAINKSAG